MQPVLNIRPPHGVKKKPDDLSLEVQMMCIVNGRLSELSLTELLGAY